MDTTQLPSRTTPYTDFVSTIVDICGIDTVADLYEIYIVGGCGVITNRRASGEVDLKHIRIVGTKIEFYDPKTLPPDERMELIRFFQDSFNLTQVSIAKLLGMHQTDLSKLLIKQRSGKANAIRTKS